jgi:hypothetical protein
MSNEYQAKSRAKSDQSLDSASPTDPAGDETKNSGSSEAKSETTQYFQPLPPPSPADASGQTEMAHRADQKQLRLSDMPLEIQEAWRNIQNWRRIEDITE